MLEKRMLQLFAEEGVQSGAGDAGASAAGDQEGVQGNQEKKQNDEYNERSDKQSDRSDEEQEAPESKKKYTDADVDRIVAKKIAAERKRMSKLFNEEQQETEIEKRVRDVLRRELTADAKDALIKDGYPSTLANIMDYSSKEDYERSYQEVTAVFREAMTIEYKRRLSGNAPRAGGYSHSEDQMIADAFRTTR